MLRLKHLHRGIMPRNSADRSAVTRVAQEQMQEKQPEYVPALCGLAVIDEALDRRDYALREGRRAVELLPVARDSFNGLPMIEYFAVNCAWTGKKIWLWNSCAWHQTFPAR